MARVVLLLLALLAAGLSSAPASAADKDELPPGIELPMRVRVAVRVLNVLQIAEVAGQGKLYVEVTQRWTDPRLRFDAVAQGFTRIDRVGEEADAYLATVWTPGLTVDNQIGKPEARTVAVSTYSNGNVVLIERYEGLFRFNMNMDAFPFDTQQLTLSFSLPRYATQDAMLLTTEMDRNLSGIEDRLSVIDWHPKRLHFTNQEAMGWNARSYSRLDATVTLQRLSERYLLRIFIPILAILAVSLFVLWSPGLQANDKGSLIFSSLLALAALSFTFEASFPGSISLNTPIAQIISLGYLYLILVLMLEVALSRGANSEKGGRLHDVCVALRRQVRWAVPAIMVLVCLGTAVRAIPA
ncbi:MAG: neurotransmitter-gated ion-channel ligand-binding protein [Pseudolabrys sp.]|nr:neurotransmitter-gated ion-channel ligand-binding protein [Pseudolabrys sp.]